MLPELDEAAALGKIKDIYTEIRSTTGVPYVSSLQRHLATRAGWLEWAWSIVGPGFRSGLIPHTVWRCAQDVQLPALEPISDVALARLGVRAHDRAAIANVLNSFIRVSPTNLGFSGIARHVLTKSTRTAPPARAPIESEQPPLSPLPPMVEIASLPKHQQEVLMSMATTVDGKDFVPGLYRMLAHWPAYFAHTVADLLSKRARADPACARLAASIDETIPGLIATLTVSDPPTNDAAEIAGVVAAIDRYRETSPQMVVYCAMMKAALPHDG